MTEKKKEWQGCFKLSIGGEIMINFQIVSIKQNTPTLRWLQLTRERQFKLQNIPSGPESRLTVCKIQEQKNGSTSLVAELDNGF